MFVMDEGTGRYVPTPSGHTMKFFAMLGDTELLIEGYTYNRHVATIDSVTGASACCSLTLARARTCTS